MVPITSSLPSVNHRCKGAPIGNWGSLGNKMTASDCASECLKDPKCKFAVYEDRGQRRCSSYENCSTKQKTKNQWQIFKKVSGGGTNDDSTPQPPEPKPKPQPAPEPKPEPKPEPAPAGGYRLVGDGICGGNDQYFQGNDAENQSQENCEQACNTNTRCMAISWLPMMASNVGSCGLHMASVRPTRPRYKFGDYKCYVKP